jgi:L-threonylcarbamoyladenylate synthase
MERISIAEVGVGAAAQSAAAVLAEGGIILYPTDTLYGLGVDVANESARAKLYALKKREVGKSLLIMLASLANAHKYVELTPRARELAEHFWPGALTLVLNAKETVPKEATLQGTIGVRVPNDAFCLALAKVFGKPITSTSANIAGEKSACTIEEILAQFGSAAEHISLVIDGGGRGSAVPSTIVSFASGAPEVLREGALSRTQLGL